jgi:hypothetical protein
VESAVGECLGELPVPCNAFVAERGKRPLPRSHWRDKVGEGVFGAVNKEASKETVVT